MKRSVDMLIDDHRLVSLAASVALVSLCLALLVLAATHVVDTTGLQEAVSTSMGVLLGATLVLSLTAMIGATFFVLRQRASLVDATLFLLLTWLVPYLAIAAYLGGSNLRRAMAGTRREVR